MKLARIFLAVFLFMQFGLSGCATLKDLSKDTEVKVGAGGFVAGAVAGYAGAPDNLNKGYNSVLWAGLIGFVSWLGYRVFSKNSKAKLAAMYKAERDAYKEQIDAIKYVSKERGYLEEVDEKGNKIKIAVCMYDVDSWVPGDSPYISYYQNKKAVKIYNPDIACPKTPQKLKEMIEKYNK